MGELTDYERAVGLAARRLMGSDDDGDPTPWECAVGFAVRLLEVALRPVIRSPGGAIVPRTFRTPLVPGLTIVHSVAYERMNAEELAGELSTRAGEVQVREHVADLIARGVAIEGDALIAFAQSIALGTPIQGRRKGEPASIGDHARKVAIKKAIALIVSKEWLSRTRNDATPEPRSACDAVAQASSLLGDPMTYDQVRKIAERP